MKRILYLSLLLVIPFFLHADHGRDRLNGKWISPYFGKQIRVKVKRHIIKIKGLDRNGWKEFIPIRRGLFEDCEGNTIRIRNIHDLTYRSAYGRDRIKFVKKGHQHHNHVCSSSCGIENDYFNYSNSGGGYDQYDNYGSGYDNYDDQPSYGSNSRNDRWDDYNEGYNRNRRDRFGGNYYVREIDEYIEIRQTPQGFKARRPNKNWVLYTQNRFRKNEYLDDRGNKYLVRNNGDLTWKKWNGKVSFNLSKRR